MKKENLKQTVTFTHSFLFLPLLSFSFWHRVLSKKVLLEKKQGHVSQNRYITVNVHKIIDINSLTTSARLI